jgi:uncharacterized protein (TIGR02421 family)
MPRTDALPPPEVIEAVDDGLVEVARAFDWIRATTPSNAEAARAAFEAAGCRITPPFRYAPHGVDTAALRARLDLLPVAAIADDDLRVLFEAKRQELLGWLEMIDLRDTDGFLPASLEQYGPVDDDLRALAETVLDRIPAEHRAGEPGLILEGPTFAELAAAEVAAYRAVHPTMPTQVRLDEDYPGVMVSGPHVIVGCHHRTAAVRAEALVHHEVGTHVVTQVNGLEQPLQLFEVGLPAFEETQEGLGVLAEHLCGGLSRTRLAQLCARVLAAAALTEGAEFAETYGLLREELGIGADRAWDVALRTHRAGGLTKDAIYLRGLDRLLTHLREGGSLDPLVLGKLALSDVPAVERLRDRGTLVEPVLRPRWLDHPAAPDLLAAIEAGERLPELADALRV